MINLDEDEYEDDANYFDDDIEKNENGHYQTRN